MDQRTGKKSRKMSLYRVLAGPVPDISERFLVEENKSCSSDRSTSVMKKQNVERHFTNNLITFIHVLIDCRINLLWIQLYLERMLTNI